MASVLIITTILNIVVSVFVNSEKQSSQLSNSQLQHNDQKDFDRRMDTISGWNQLKREQPNSNMLKNQPLNKRKKRQILFLVNRRPVPEALFRMPKTTQNPFIRETNVDEYDIGGPAEIEHVPQAGDSSSRIDSHQLVKEELFQIAKQMDDYKSENKISKHGITSLENLSSARKLLNWSINFLLKNTRTVLHTNEISFPTSPSDINILKYMLYHLNTIPSKSPKVQDHANKRVKRRVNKTLQRKKAKKRKQKQRRVERKRLRMLTHARRVRKQQKSKQARLQRHYARMNMTTTLFPQHTSRNCSINQTQIPNQISQETSKTDSIDNSSEYGSDDEYYDEDDTEDDDSEDENESDDTAESSDGPSYRNDSDDYEDYDSEDDESKAESIDYENVNKDSGKSSNKRKIKKG